jgi:arginyl-tRNA synthetase
MARQNHNIHPSPRVSSIEEEALRIPEVIGMSAIRYFDLNAGRRSYILDYSGMLNFKGNTSVYLQYTYTRFHSVCTTITSKVQLKKLSAGQEGGASSSFNAYERQVALSLSRFHDTIETTANSLSPNLLCEQLFVLAQKANMFYEHCRVDGAKEEHSRLMLCEAVVNALSCGMRLLGINRLEKM